VSDDELRDPYDHRAEAYRDWWGPMIRPAAVRLLDRLPPSAVAGSPTILDVGTGTGALALAALERWPGASAIGIDASRGMLEVARREARAAGHDARLRLEAADAGQLPVGDGSVDVAVTSFVIQLVPSRAAMLREIRRALRPGGIVACVSWLVDPRPFEPDDAFERALDDLDLPDLDGDHPEPDPWPSVAAAAREFRRAGFRDVRAAPEVLEHRFSPESYLDLLEHWMEVERFEALDAQGAAHLRAAALAQFRRLPAGAFHWRAPLVSVVAERG
jgi:SAM-dependent methyltransferase